MRDSVANSFLAQAGGNLKIQGNQNIDILALNHPQTPFVSGGNLSLISDGNVSGDAHFFSGGQFSIQNLAGGAGNFVSLHDPIIRANSDVEFGNYTGAALKVEATGSIKGGDITINSPDTSGSIPISDPDQTTLTTKNALILRAGVYPATPINVPSSTGGTSFITPVSPLNLPTGSIQVGNINTSSGVGGLVYASATANISTGTVTTNRGSIYIIGDDVTLGSLSNIPNNSSNVYDTEVYIIANKIALLGEATSTPRLGYSIFLNAPYNSNRDIVVGGSADSGAGTLDLTASTLNALQDGLSHNIRIGTSGTGKINVISATINGGLSLTANEIDFTGGVGSVHGGSLFLQTPGTNQNIVVGGTTDSGAGTLDITTTDLEALKGSLSSFSLQTNGTGTIQVQGVLDVAQSTSFTANEIDFLGGAGSIHSSSVTLQPASNDQNIVVGGLSDTGAGTLDLTASDINALQTSLSYFYLGIGKYDGTGTIDVLGTLTASGLYLYGNEINLLGGAGSIRSSSVTLQPGSSNQNIVVGGLSDTGTGTLDLTASDINALQTPLNSLTIGRYLGTGTIDVLGTLAADNLNFYGNEINLLGGVGSVNSKSIYLQPGSNTQDISVGGLSDSNANTLDITLDDLNALSASSSSINIRTPSNSTGTIRVINNPTPLNFGSLSLSAALGSIEIDGAINVTNSISLSGKEIDFLGGVGSIRANLVSISPVNNTDIALGGTSDSGSEILDLTATDLNALQFTGSNPFLSINNYGATNTTRILSPLNVGGSLYLYGNNTGKTIIGSDVTANGSIYFSGPINFTNDTKISSSKAGYFITFSDSVAAGTSNLTLEADSINFPNPGTAPNLKTVTGTGNLILQPTTPSQNIAINGSYGSYTDSFNNLNTLSNGFNSITIGRSNGTGNIALNSINFQDPVTILSPTGSITFNSGGITATDNASVTLNAPITTLNAGITTNNQPINFLNQVLLGNSANVALNSGNANISFGNTIDGAGNLSLAAGTGNINFGGALGSVTPLSSLNTASATNTTIPGNITTTGDINISSLLTLTGSGSKEFNAGTGTIALNNSLATGSNNLTLTANEINLPLTSNSVTGSGNLLLQPFTSSQNITLGGSSDSGANTLDLSTNDLAALQNGFNSITIGRNDSSGAITIDSNGVTFKDPVKIQSPIGAGSITANGTINGTDNASINLLANQDIKVYNTFANNQDITITSNNGAINSINFLDSGTTSGGGAITLLAKNDISTISVVSSSGDIKMTSTNGNISASSTNASSLNSAGGSITLDAQGNITGNSLYSTTYLSGTHSGNITATSRSGMINFVNAFTQSDNENGGNIDFNADKNIQVIGSISTRGLTGGGNIDMTSTNGSISTYSLLVDATNGKGGAVNLIAPLGVTTDSVVTTNNNVNLKSSMGTVATQDITTDGGRITFEAKDSIKAGELNSSSSTGNGGNVTLDPDNDIEVTSINAQGGSNGTGGNVDITTNKFFRATDTFSDRNGIKASISTSGGTSSGDITIRHGGNGNTPFVVGDATTNGTAAAITTGSSNTISPNQSFPSNYTQGNIKLITQESPKVSTPTKQLPANSPNPEQLARTINTLPPTTTNNSFALFDTAFAEVDEQATRQFDQYLGQSSGTSIKSLADARAALSQIQAKTGVKPAIIYAQFTPSSNTSTKDKDILDLVVVTAEGKPIRKRLPGVTRAKVLRVAQKFYNEISDVNKAGTTSYLISAQQLYKWLILPQEAELQKQGIKNLAFVMDSGLRSIPLAALHDGKQFLIEKYSLGMLPSLSLTDTSYWSLD
ncbi:CHAT domain-containing protein [Nostoc sp.]|uniref:CHAT domain-containing protein n=1 Tax=Nostoc sp. TaxID=1180 RepID=UPI002FF654CF